MHEQFGYAYDRAWNLNWRTNNDLKVQFNVDNLNQLSTAGGLFKNSWGVLLSLLLASVAAAEQEGASSVPQGRFQGPSAVAASRDGKHVYVAFTDAPSVICLETERLSRVGSVQLPAAPAALTLSADGSRLLVACAAPQSELVVCSTPHLQILQKMPAGHTASAVLVNAGGDRAYVCNRFDNDVSAVDLGSGTLLWRMPAAREPVSMAASIDGRLLLVANALPSGRSDRPYVAAAITVLDANTGEEVGHLHLPNGSGDLKAISLSPDGKHAVITHLVAQFGSPPLHLYLRWMNGNALTLVDVQKRQVLGSVLLDDRGKGAANPWAVAWSEDSRTLLVTHAGTHEISVIDFASLLGEVLNRPAPIDPGQVTLQAALGPEAVSSASYLSRLDSLADEGHPGPGRRSAARRARCPNLDPTRAAGMLRRCKSDAFFPSSWR